VAKAPTEPTVAESPRVVDEVAKPETKPEAVVEKQK
jgi:hypothetical protein